MNLSRDIRGRWVVRFWVSERHEESVNIVYNDHILEEVHYDIVRRSLNGVWTTNQSTYYPIVYKAEIVEIPGTDS